MIKKAKKIYYNDKILQSEGNSKLIWEVINEALNRKTTSNEKVEQILLNGETLTEPKDIANAFNNHFVNIGSNTSNSVPPVDKDFKDYLTRQNSVLNSFLPPPIANIDLINTVLHLNKKKSKDINELSIPIIQSVIQEIALPLTHIYNLSVQLGIFPEN